MRILPICFLCFLLLTGAVRAQETVVSPPALPQIERKPLFQIRMEGDVLTITLYSGDSLRTATGRLSALKRTQENITIGAAQFEKDSLRIGTVAVPYELLYDVRVEKNSSKDKLITFLSRESGTTGTTRLRGNRTGFADSIVVDSGGFVRGMIFSVDGATTIKGEVNRSVVSLFQDITLKSNAVVRGSIVTLDGSLHIDRASAVYGDIVGSSINRKGRQRYNYEFSDYLTIGGKFNYNRVDGATPWGQVRFHDPDSLWPVMYGAIGYAFASERLRLRIGAEKKIVHTTPVTVGAAYFRALQSSGDFNPSELENTLAALLAREDFRDYYESIGGTFWASMQASKHLTFTTGYRYESTNWLDAHKNLWSLFGGDKRFNANYRYLDSASREAAMSNIDTASNGMWQLEGTYTTRNGENLFGKSSWSISGDVDWSVPSLGSDFDYSRYLLQADRVQILHHGGAGYMHLAYGGRGGTLPLHKLFFLGGPNNLRGYKPNRFAGDNILMVNAEYRVEIPKTMLAISGFYDGALILDKTGNPDKELTDAPGLGDAGIALYLFYEKGILSLAWPTGYKPDGNKPVFYIRLHLNL